MAYQSKQSLVLGQQLKVEEICLLANNPLISVVASDLNLQLSEPLSPSSVLMCLKQVAAGTVTGVACTIGADGTSITITGESAAAATTAYLIKYVMKQS